MPYDLFSRSKQNLQLLIYTNINNENIRFFAFYVILNMDRNRISISIIYNNSYNVYNINTSPNAYIHLM